MEVSKLNDKIDITIEDNHITKNLSSNSGKDNKDEYKNLRQTLTTNNRYKRPPLLLLMVLISNINNFNNSKIKKSYNLYIKSKYIKIVSYKKMALTT